MATNPVAKRLREARTAAGLSQKSLGIASGIDEFSASARMNQYETEQATKNLVNTPFLVHHVSRHS